jgi:hypothetical protein
MDILPLEALPPPAHLAPVFSRPTYRRFLILAAASILTIGRRNVAGCHGHVDVAMAPDPARSAVIRPDDRSVEIDEKSRLLRNAPGIASSL